MRRANSNHCHYCENPAAFGLLDSKTVMYDHLQFNSGMRLNQDGSNEVIGWEKVTKTRLIHPQAIPVTGFQGVACAHGEDK
jgi:hypothetical protein